MCTRVLVALSLLTTCPAPAQEPNPVGAEYRKLESFLTILRTRNAQQFAIDPAKGIHESAFLPIGGIEQWVTIRGQDRSNPVLLLLHGGPGDVTNPWTFSLLAPWEAQFTIVQWDQRGAGRTFRRNGAAVAPTMTLDRMAADGIELLEYLRKHLGKGKIIVAGHSFGSILGLLIVRARPDLCSAYVGTGQVADNTRNYTVAYRELLRHAQATGNRQAIDELQKAGPPPYSSGAGYRVQWKWANRFEGADQFLNGTLGLTLVAPGSSAADLNSAVEGQMFSGEHLVPQTQSLTRKDLGLEFAVPMFFLQGTEDFTTPSELARQYLAAIKAPRKEFVPVAGGHFALFMNSSQFLRELVKRVGRP